MHAHVLKCEKRAEDNSTLRRAVYLACTVIYNDGIVDIYTKAYINPIPKYIVVDAIVMAHKLKGGWVCKPKRGYSMGINVVGQYVEKIKYWIELGTADPGKKLVFPG